jgi:NAD(P)-dependent dehydrogenase (short-subunit alcohol dehydrogenase family)
MKPNHKVALITGSGSGMGRASAILFSQEGARISVVDVDRTAGKDGRNGTWKRTRVGKTLKGRNNVVN